MPQLHCYVPDAIAARVQQRAQAHGLSVSRYLAEIVKREVGVTEWPDGFFEKVVGGWKGEALQRYSQGQFEVRKELQPEM